MTQTTESARPSRKSDPSTGVRAIAWNPDRDSQAAPAPQGYSSIRGYEITWVDEERTKQVSVNPVTKGITPRFTIFALPLVGLNWVDAALWEKAKEISAARKDWPAGDRIQQLLDDRAIIAFPPKAGLTKFADLREGQKRIGSWNDYEPQVMEQIVMNIFDENYLRALQKETNIPALSARIGEAIARLEKEGSFRNLS